MSDVKKRAYNSKARNVQAEQTRIRILNAAKNLFQEVGFERVKIEEMAQAAQVSASTIYALFQSKRGVLRALIDEALPPDQFNSLVEMSVKENSPRVRLSITAKIARQIYDAEQEHISIFQSIADLVPELRELEKEREQRRYQRQEVTIESMRKESSLKKNLCPVKARDILWVLTGRDMYRMLVMERKWTSDQYEKWLTDLLIYTLVDQNWVL